MQDISNNYGQRAEAEKSRSGWLVPVLAADRLWFMQRSNDGWNSGSQALLTSSARASCHAAERRQQIGFGSRAAC